MLYMFLAEGFEETEAIGSLDVIRRGQIDIQTVSIGNEHIVCGNHGIKVEADILKEDIDFKKMTGIILPGGLPGTTNLQKDDVVQMAINHCKANNLLICAICAAPMVLGEAGVLEGKDAVCYPGFEGHLKGANIKDELCTWDGNVICGKGAGAAMLFGAKIVDYFKAGEGSKILDSIYHM